MSTGRKTPARKAKLIPAEEVFAKLRKKPGYKAAYDALEEEFALISALIKARAEAGMTQEQVAASMESTQSAIARLESGGRLPSTRTLQKYAKATGHRLRISFERQPSKP